MKFKAGDIIEIEDNCKNYFHGCYGIENNTLFKVIEVLKDRVRCLQFPENMYHFYFSPEEIKLFKQEEIKEEDIL